MEMKNRELLNKNSDLDDQTEELYREIANLRKTGSNARFVKLANENKTLNDMQKKEILNPRILL